MTQTPRSLSDPGICMVSKELDSSRPKPKTVNPGENYDQMPKRTSRSLSNESVISYFAERHTKKDLHDGSSSSEITKLVANAGSAEAVISYLLKEKNSQASQNTQLWRLVDKQRAMILGLNGDLQRALKEKERYRKKIKEIVGKLTVSDNDNSSEKPKSHPKTENKDDESNCRIFLEDTSTNPTKRHDECTPDLPIEATQALDPIVSISAEFDDGKVNNLVKPDNMTSQSNRAPLPKNLPEFSTIQDAENHNTDKYSDLKTSSTEITDTSDTSDTTEMTDVTDITDSTDATDVSLPTAKANIILSSTDESPSKDTKKENKEVEKDFLTHRKAPPTSVKVEKEKKNEFTDYRSPDFRLNCEIRKESALEARNLIKDPNDTQRKVMKCEIIRPDQVSGIGKSSESSVSKTVPNNIQNEPARKQNLPKASNHNIANPERNPILTRRERAHSEIYLSRSTTSRLSLISPSTGLPSSPRPVKHTSGLTPTKPYLAKLTNSPQSSPDTVEEISQEGNLLLDSLSQVTSLQQLPDIQRLSISVTGVPKYDPFNLVTPKPLVIVKDKETNQSPIGSSSSQESKEYESDGIYRGFISEEYPGLLLPPSALAQVEVKVASSRLKPSRSSIMFPKNAEEDPVFTLALFTKSVRREIWQIEKDLTSLIELDSTLKQYTTYNSKIPDKSLFNGHAPAKVDSRRIALNKYFASVLENRSDFAAILDICKYLSSNVLGVNAEELQTGQKTEDNFKASPGKKSGTKKLKSGYLTKRGKNFGGWKARYFILDGPVLKYYESHGGSYLGAIRLHQAQIGKQSQTSDKGDLSQGEGDDSDRHYRHAFLILEPKKKNSSSLIRHVLCAESDAERDEWVDALCQYMKYKDPDKKKSSSEQLSQTNSNGSKQKVKVQPQRNQATQESSEDLFHAISYEETKLTSKPLIGKKDITETASLIENVVDKESSDGLSQPQSPKDTIAFAQSSTSQNFRPNEQTKPSTLDEKMKYRKRSFFGFGARAKNPVEDSDNVAGRFPKNTIAAGGDQKPRLKAIFGMPLDEAVKYSHPLDVSVELPAVVYRCIEYLDAMHAFDEEGIFRLSGSSIVIKQLRERFNSEGDVDLIKDNQYYDIHAVASLLKLYLRELPSTILTGKLHPEFLAIIDLVDTKEQINVISGLVRKLPTENVVLLRHLASFLIKIIRKSDINRMTVRNVSIVFSPTLNIPASIFSLFLQQYYKIFDREPDYCSNATETSLNSSNESAVANKEQTADNRKPNRAATVLAGPTFNKSIGASKTYRQNISSNNNKTKKRDSSMFGINMTSLSQRRGSINK
ncbi:hypothetical protein GcC1_013009 [Golovinomyces cichoracearum]|uniref:RhoGAP-domain-containing protein n=1 Tax=Golovinomyces cichoracearum TaxID=62708 RepID=A0A420J732_9PEZI|nr:hypothetical protein GcC1_013009 [Golovinomyces cichoracearum]